MTRPRVHCLNHLKSSGRCQGRRAPVPMTPLRATAAIAFQRTGLGEVLMGPPDPVRRYGLKVGKLSRTMPNRQEVHRAPGRSKVVDDPVRRDRNLPHIASLQSRANAARRREVGIKDLDRVKNAGAELAGGNGVVRGNEPDQFPQILDRGLQPDHFEVHARTRRRTSSFEAPPAPASLGPTRSRTVASRARSSRISCSVESGDIARILSITSSQSLMRESLPGCWPAATAKRPELVSGRHPMGGVKAWPLESPGPPSRDCPPGRRRPRPRSKAARTHRAGRSHGACLSRVVRRSSAARSTSGTTASVPRRQSCQMTIGLKWEPPRASGFRPASVSSRSRVGAVK